MKQYVTSICVFTTTLIFLISICVLTCSAKMTSYILEKQESVIVTRGIKGIDDAKNVIQKDFEEKALSSSREAYFSITTTLYDGGVNVTEEDANYYYRKTSLQMLRKQYGLLGCSKEEADARLKTYLEDLLPELKIGELSITEASKPYLELIDNKMYLRDVTVGFTYGSAYFRDHSFELSKKLDDIMLFDENPELFEYSMIADKGIYITGKTSTIMGNIYAGTHGPSDLRKAEALYGESESYGGLNIMSTQVAIDSDKIVTDGNINMRGAFVVLGDESTPVTISAKEILESDTLASKNMYALFGNVDDSYTADVRAMSSEAMKYFGSIEQYYDSDNDKSYIGKYRKIISSTDITVSSDVTGVVMTPGSVIIEEGVNVEGLILSGDRIYIQGNNNIVSSVDVLRNIVKEELYDPIYSEEKYDTDEERALNSIHLNMKDYMGGIKERGFIISDK